MTLSGEDYLKQKNKAVTLMGMSGVGKTTLAANIEDGGWYHYSADYRIGSAYLEKPVIQDISRHAGNIPFLKDLLDSGTVSFQSHASVHDLKLFTQFQGMVGNPEKGGLSKKEFRKRQHLYKDAEIKSMLDVPFFIRQAQHMEGKPHFLNDATGSLCELDAPEVLETLTEHTIILYLKATEKDEKELFDRAMAYPKPLFYPDDFFEEAITQYMEEKGLGYVALIDPDEFYRWVFPKLFNARLPKYQKIADDYGYTITTDELRAIKNADDFNETVARAIDRKNS